MNVPPPPPPGFRRSSIVPLVVLANLERDVYACDLVPRVRYEVPRRDPRERRYAREFLLAVKRLCGRRPWSRSFGCGSLCLRALICPSATRRYRRDLGQPFLGTSSRAGPPWRRRALRGHLRRGSSRLGGRDILRAPRQLGLWLRASDPVHDLLGALVLVGEERLT